MFRNIYRYIGVVDLGLNVGTDFGIYSGPIKPVPSNVWVINLTDDHVVLAVPPSSPQGRSRPALGPMESRGFSESAGLAGLLRATRTRWVGACGSP